MERVTTRRGKRGKGGVVQIFAKYEAQDAITDREKVMEVRQVGGRQLQQIMRSGKVRASGVFAYARGFRAGISSLPLSSWTS